MTSWADQFNTYQDACDFYGCDGPRELAAEARYEAGSIEMQDWMEAHGRPYPDWRKKYDATGEAYDPDFIPF